MADTIANYTGNGTQTDFVVPFDYLKKSFVHVYVNNGFSLLTGGDYGDTGADYYFLDDTTIRLKTAPAEGEGIVVRRYTSATERIVSFEDASILKATDLDTSQLQAFHIAEEARDNVKDAMLRDDEGNWDAQNTRIVNVADPVDDQDAMTLGYYKKDKQSVIDLKNETKGYRDEALGFRNEAEEFKDTTKGYKDDAEESKNLAKDWAVKMDGKVVEEGEEIDYSAKYWAQSVAEMGEAAKVVADNIDDVNTVADNIDNVNTVAGDLEGTFKPPQFTDMGRVGTGETEEIEVTGGNIKTVSDNIEDVNSVASAIEDGSLQTAIDSVPVTVENVRLSNEAKDGAVAASNKAKDWAIKMDGKVTDDAGLEVDYSSKYYADQAKASAEEANVSADVVTEAVTEGVSQINALSQQNVTEITNAGTEQVNNVNTAGTAQVEAVNTAGSTQVSAVEDEGASQVSAVTAEGTKQTGLVTAEGTNQITLVGQKGDSVIATIDSSKDGLIEELQTEGTAQIGLIETAGTTQVGNVNTAGTTQVSNVNDAGDTQVQAVNTAGTNQISAIGTAAEEAIADLEPYVEKAQAWAEKTDGPVEGGSYSAKYWANQASSGQLNADWNETDSSNKGYIKNKPDLSVYAEKTYVDSALSSALVYQGSVNTYADLPVASQKVGDMYNVAQADSSHGIKAGDNVAWNGTAWDVLAGAVDLSAYLTKSSAASTYATIDDLDTTNNSIDTLETTVGTKANDSAVVKLTGNQTIAGTKTFSSTIAGNINGTARNVTERYTKTSRGDIEYGENNNYLIDKAALAFWNGRYSGTSSNLEYCRYGTIIDTTRDQTIGGTKTFSETIVGSINGNAATADKLKTARTINGTSFNGSANININNIVSRGQVTALSGSTRGSIKGIQLYEAYNNGYPYSYGNVIHMRGARESYGGDNEIMFTWNGTDRVFIRSLRDTATSEWTEWSELQVVRTDYGRVGS
jgi:hypothetical protein